MVDVAEVRIWNELVGAVRWNDSQQLGYFQFDPQFIQKGWNLNQYNSKPEKRVFR